VFKEISTKIRWQTRKR